MSARDFKLKYKDKAIMIPLSKIRLVDEIHLKGNPAYECRHLPRSELCVIVRKAFDGYVLVSGWADYMDCIKSGYGKVKAIVTNYTHEHFLRIYGDTYLPITELKVPQCMAESTPKPWKLRRVRDRLGAKCKLDKPITIDHNKVILDGYTRYLVALEIGMVYVPIRWLQ